MRLGPETSLRKHLSWTSLCLVCPFVRRLAAFSTMHEEAMINRVFVVLVVTVAWSGYGTGEVCTVGNKPDNLGNNNRSESTGVFLSTESPVTCNGTLVSWSFCYFLDREVKAADKPKIKVFFGLWRVERQNSTNGSAVYYSLVSESQWSPLSSVLGSPFEFICQIWTLPEEMQFDVSTDDELVVGVHVPSDAPMNTLHLVGESGGNTVYHCDNWTQPDQAINATSLRTINYGLYLEAGIGTPVLGTSTPRTTPADVEETDSPVPLWSLFIIAVLATAVISFIAILIVIMRRLRTHHKAKYSLRSKSGSPQDEVVQELRTRVLLASEASTGNPTTKETAFISPAAVDNDQVSCKVEAEDSPHILAPQRAYVSPAMVRYVSAVTARSSEKTASNPKARLKRSNSESDIVLVNPGLSTLEALVPPPPGDSIVYEDLDDDDKGNMRHYTYAGPHLHGTDEDDLYAIPKEPGELLSSLDSETAYSYAYHEPKKKHRRDKQAPAQRRLVTAPPRHIPRRSKTPTKQPAVVTATGTAVSDRPPDINRDRKHSASSEDSYVNEDEYKVDVGVVRPKQGTSVTGHSKAAASKSVPESDSVSVTLSEDIYMNEEECPARPIKGEKAGAHPEVEYTRLSELTREEQTVYQIPS